MISAKLATNSVISSKIANGAVTSGKIANGSVRSGQLGGGVVTEPKLKNAAVGCCQAPGRRGHQQQARLLISSPSY